MNNKIKIAFVDVKQSEEDYLKEHMPEIFDYTMSSEPINATFSDFSKISGVEILSVFTSSRVTGEIINNFPNLKMITTRSTGFNHIDLDYCKEHGIAVVNVPRYGEATVAEFTFGLMLNVMRNITLAYDSLKSGVVNMQGFIGHDLCGKTLGIVGTGAIGCHVVQIAKGFSLKIIAYDPYPKETLVKEQGVEYVSMEELCERSDIISVHAPATKANYHMINENFFNKMKKGVIIVNTARGEIIDTEALYKAISRGIVAGAGLDVLECEDILMEEDKYLMKIDCVKQDCLVKTLINHKLLDLPNVIVTPHMAFDSVEAIHRILNTTFLNLEGYIKGNIINSVI